MSINDKEAPVSSSKRAHRLRIIGVALLLLGIAGAGLVYWRGTRSPDLSDDISMVGYNRAQSLQMAQLYGKEGVMIEDLQNDLKQPGTQAEIIVAVSILITIGCFFIAGRLDDGNETR